MWNQGILIYTKFLEKLVACHKNAICHQRKIVVATQKKTVIF